MNKSFPFINARQQSPILHKWTISREKLDILCDLEYSSFSTKFLPVPSAAPIKYGLRLSYGDEKIKDMAILRFELMNFSDEYEYYDCNISFEIKSANFSFDLRTRLTQKYRFGTFILCHSWKGIFEKENGFFNSNDEMIIEVQGVIVNGFEYTDEERKEIIDGHKMWLAEASKNKHIEVRFGDQTQNIKLHEEIYDQMLRESYRKNLQFISTDYPFEIVEKAIKFHYNPQLVFMTTIEQLFKIRDFFHRYGSNDTILNFEDFLLDQLDEFNVCRMLYCARQYRATPIINICFTFLMKCIRLKTCVADFDLIPPQMALDILKQATRVRRVEN